MLELQNLGYRADDVVRLCEGLNLPAYKAQPYRAEDFGGLLKADVVGDATPEELALLAAAPSLAELRARSRKADAAERYPVLTARFLAEPSKPMAWLVRGFWPLGSHGPLGGPKKVLKSYNADAIALAVASGSPLLGNSEWRIEHPRPVIIMAGEGGVGPRRRRLQRIARDVYGIDFIGDRPLAVLPAIAPFDSKALREYLARAIDAVGGDGVLIVDSVYNYHPSGQQVNVSNVYDRGPMFGRLSKTVYELGGEDQTMLLVDHFRKTGSDRLDLDSISQAGIGEFADSWMLLQHREAADPDAGNFWLRAELGSRQDWPGAGWELDWSIGRFDEDSREFTDRIAVAVSRCNRAAQAVKQRVAVTEADIIGAVLDLVEREPWLLTKDQIIDGVAGKLAVGNKRVRPVLEDLEKSHELVCESRKRPEGAGRRRTERTRDVWALGDGKKRLPHEPVPMRNARGIEAY